MKIKKGKILKIKLGYNPNCSAAMGRFDFIYFSMAVVVIINIVASAITAIILYKRRLSEISKNKDIKSKDIKNEDKI